MKSGQESDSSIFMPLTATTHYYNNENKSTSPTLLNNLLKELKQTSPYQPPILVDILDMVSNLSLTTRQDECKL